MLQEKEEKWPLKPCKLASSSFLLWLRHETLLKTHLHSCIIVDWFDGLVTSTLKLHLVSVDGRKLDWSNKINGSVAHDPRSLNGGYRHKDGGWIHFNQIAITEKKRQPSNIFIAFYRDGARGFFFVFLAAWLFSGIQLQSQQCHYKILLLYSSRIDFLHYLHFINSIFVRRHTVCMCLCVNCKNAMHDIIVIAMMKTASKCITCYLPATV